MTGLESRFGEGGRPAQEPGAWRLLVSANWEGYWDGEQVVSRVVDSYGLPLWPARWTVVGTQGTASYELTVEYRLGGRGLVTVVSLWTTAPAEDAEPRPPWLEPLIWRVLHPDDD
ncbi:MAG: hypothetical protein K6U87_02035 [Firmicutes bacterium]|nr:hypothetical protein [Bacillota bacterium]